MIKLKNLNTKKIIFEIMLLFLVFFTLFIPNEYSKEVLTIFLFIYTVISFTFFKKVKKFSLNNKKVFIQMLVFALIYVIGYYFIGIYSGFYKNPMVANIKIEIKYLIITTLIIVLSELIRYILISSKEKHSLILIVVSMIIIDVILYAQIYDLTKLDDLLAMLGLIIFASIAENLFYNYICIQFGYKPVIIYRFITILYAYVIPILPEMHTYFKAIIRIVYPYFIYLFLDNIYSSNDEIISRTTKTKKIVSSISVIIIGLILASIISCKFYIGAIAIGSDSMKRTIDKGDAVIYVKYTNQNLRIGDIIIFKKNNIKLIHRIIKIENVNNELRFTTKGDNNSTEDQGYITSIDIMGISKVKLKYIGYPSILLGEFFNSIKK